LQDVKAAPREGDDDSFHVVAFYCAAISASVAQFVAAAEGVNFRFAANKSQHADERSKADCSATPKLICSVVRAGPDEEVHTAP